ncbi:hypothetical protein EV652_1042 [Kribbella steppae]|uniref:PASTA domain-containing protein n=1 Tax=Kribbella steppae TaxID=2512223 RepID=A0A4R2HNG0_9ACTN|nr:hypothetical protein [Kribbella steppae]TCO32396.1 hypothetical protein EV652_1042 [Kribbella steppae]
MRRFGVVAVVVAALLVACGNESGAEGQPTVNSRPLPETPAAASGPVEQAKADLAKRLGVEAAQVTVVSSSEVTWPDGSLGCPEPGMNYTQALVPGSRIILEAAGKQYHYHSGGTRPPFLCTNPQR